MQLKTIALILLSLNIAACAVSPHKKARLLSVDSTEKTDYSNIPSYEQFEVCENLIRLKRFRQFDYCINDYRRHIVNGKMTVITRGLFSVTEGRVNRDYTIAYLNGTLALSYLARSDVEKAISYGELALTGVQGKPARVNQENYADTYRVFISPPIYGVLAIAEGIRGNVKKAQHYINQLEDLDLSILGAGAIEPVVRTWIAKGYLSINQPEKALEAITNESFNSFDVLTTVNYINPFYYLTKAVTGFDLGDVEIMRKFEKNAIICKTLFLLDNAEAYSCYKNILENNVTRYYGGVQFMALQDMGSIEVVSKQYALAEKSLLQAIELLESQRSSIATDTHKMGFVGDKLSVYQDLVKVKLALGKATEAFEIVERGKSRALIDMLASKQKLSSKKSDLGSQSILAELDKATVNAYARPQIVSESDNATVRGLKLKNIQNKLKKVDAELASLLTVSSHTATDIQKEIKSNETIVEYYGKDNEFYAFVVTPDKVTSITLDVSNLNESVNTYRAALSEPNSSSYKKVARALYLELFQPVEQYIHTTNVTIIPHGALHYVPFAALYDGNRFLLDKYQIRFLPSASVMQFINKPKSTGQGSLLILGNPDLKNTSLDLPGAEEESLTIARLIAGSKVLTRSYATETALKKYGPRFDKIHFAMHGQFDNEEPLSSRLLMAKDESNDGYLTVSELYDLHLDTDLVTLSACQTALGETANGDDVIGFTRGFLYAGARSIVSSLWSVDDKATRDLMLSFYQNLRKYDKGASLRLAQQKVKQQYQHPYYWAAFQLTGNSR